jgi:hypothetical protein
MSGLVLVRRPQVEKHFPHMNYIDQLAAQGTAALSTVTTRCVGLNYYGLCRWQSKQDLKVIL